MKPKQQRREEAEARQAEYEARSLAAKLRVIESRRGGSIKEFNRLTKMGKGKK